MKTGGIIFIVMCFVGISFADDELLEIDHAADATLTMEAAQDFYNMDMTFAAPEVSFSVAEIVEVLEIAERLIGGVNDLPQAVIGSTILLYQIPPPPLKPSEKLRKRALQLEQDEKDLNKLLDLLTKLRRIK